MLANVDSLNTDTLQIIPLRDPGVVELVKALYDRHIAIDEIEMLYNSLCDYYSGPTRAGGKLYGE